ncbi:hypothetical protein [Microbulbifer sp. 2205BS26-8]|uniref:hypothetical protein n=1 Tax=Microbulbifer sp. 2205BS26-8 TaxID=3064386 RepID=UPI00273FB8C0|nr:hypothetical protein [Microbulbifer sp. 2205BS26-8]MDP5209442.1 hypothetical protein [Microbulbifer sp. 2205BS26-8]
MNELERAEYLSVLGVTSYVPRFVLPLAPAPRQAQLPPALSAVATSQRQRAAPAVLSPLPQSAAPAVDSIATAPASDSAKASVAVPTWGKSDEAVAQPQQAVQPFILSCWRIGEELLAVDSHEPGAALPMESLFGNILRALNWHQLPCQHERLCWPITENPFAPAAGASEARDTFSSWLEASCTRQPVKSIWLMGDEARTFCTPISLDETVNNWQGVRILPLPSLSQLLREPERKQDLWQLLCKAYPSETRAQ